MVVAGLVLVGGDVGGDDTGDVVKPRMEVTKVVFGASLLLTTEL